MKDYQESIVVKQLQQKLDVKTINPNTKEILIFTGNEKQSPANDIGNKSWGKISFLVNYCGWKQRFVIN